MNKTKYVNNVMDHLKLELEKEKIILTINLDRILSCSILWFDP